MYFCNFELFEIFRRNRNRNSDAVPLRLPFNGKPNKRPEAQQEAAIASSRLLSEEQVVDMHITEKDCTDADEGTELEIRTRDLRE